MKLPGMKNVGRNYKIQTIHFKGLNRRQGAVEGELSAGRNLSTAKYPALSVREGRVEQSGYRSPTAIFGWDKLVAVDGTSLYYDAKMVGTVLEGEKQFAVVNSKLCIWPDGVYVDLVTQKFASLGASLQAIANTASTTANTITMQPQPFVERDLRFSFGIGPLSTNPLVPWFRSYAALSWTKAGGWTGSGQRIVQTPAIGDKMVLMASDVDPSGYGWVEHIWRDHSTGAPSPSEFGGNDNQNGYYGVVTKAEGAFDMYDKTYVRIWADIFCFSNENEKFSAKFKVGDTVKISGSVLGNNDKMLNVTAVEDFKLTVAGALAAGAETGTLKVAREIPPLDFICESGNRLWGLSNAADAKLWDAESKTYKQTTSRMVYASALGDPTNWYTFAGVDTDSYQVAVASKGDFTGLIGHSTAVLCMKEDKVYKVFGDYPSNYQMFDYDIEGVKAGCRKSMQILGEVLYYVGKNGVYAYTGNTPELISYPLGDAGFERAAAGSDGVRYFLSVTEGTAHHLFVYDTRHQIWTREDGTHALDFARVSGVLYMIAGDKVVAMEQAAATEVVPWEATLAVCDEGTMKRKRYKWLQARTDLEAGAQIQVFYRADGGREVSAGTITQVGTHTVQLPLAPLRCDRLEIRISGTGKGSLLAMERAFYLGSEV